VFCHPGTRLLEGRDGRATGSIPKTAPGQPADIGRKRAVHPNLAYPGGAVSARLGGSFT